MFEQQISNTFLIFKNIQLSQSFIGKYTIRWIEERDGRWINRSPYNVERAFWHRYFNISQKDILEMKIFWVLKYYFKFKSNDFIAVVEMMAAGLITIAHRSGGPLMDIIVEDPSIRNGFLAVHDKE